MTMLDIDIEAPDLTPVDNLTPITSALLATLIGVDKDGISKADVVGLQGICPDLLTDDVILESYTEYPSGVNLEHGMQGILKSIWDAIWNSIKFVFTAIWKGLAWIYDKTMNLFLGKSARASGKATDVLKDIRAGAKVDLDMYYNTGNALSEYIEENGGDFKSVIADLGPSLDGFRMCLASNGIIATLAATANTAANKENTDDMDGAADLFRKDIEAAGKDVVTGKLYKDVYPSLAKAADRVKSSLANGKYSSSSSADNKRAGDGHVIDIGDAMIAPVRIAGRNLAVVKALRRGKRRMTGTDRPDQAQSVKSFEVISEYQKSAAAAVSPMKKDKAAANKAKNKNHKLPKMPKNASAEVTQSIKAASALISQGITIIKHIYNSSKWNLETVVAITAEQANMVDRFAAATASK